MEKNLKNRLIINGKIDKKYDELMGKIETNTSIDNKIEHMVKDAKRTEDFSIVEGVLNKIESLLEILQEKNIKFWDNSLAGISLIILVYSTLFVDKILWFASEEHKPIVKVLIIAIAIALHIISLFISKKRLKSKIKKMKDLKNSIYNEINK